MDFTKKYKLGSETPLSVSEYIGFLNEVLKRIRARLIGEVSELQIAASGHVYFSLRDKSDGGVLKCVIWRSNYQICGVKLKEGMEIIVSGNADIYPERGSFAFKAETVELVGEGVLKKAYDELKEKLDKEGIFSEERKRSIPEYPSSIGVITSLRSGTVIHDFMSNLGKFGFKIKAMDSRVEGQEAVKDLLKCVRKFKNQKIEVLVLIRGGGSLQSLMAFDNETLVREIADFPVPVIAGIGHHKDVTLAALAADASESTPNAVAHLLNRQWEKTVLKIERYEKSITKDYSYLLMESRSNLAKSISGIIGFFNVIIDNFEKSEKRIVAALYEIARSITIKKSKIKELKASIFANFNFLLENQISLILEFEKNSRHNNPEKQLKLGYAIVKHKGKILKNILSVNTGDLINIQLYKGKVVSEIKKKIK